MRGRLELAVLFLAGAAISLAAFIDACNTTGTAHQRAAWAVGGSLGGLAGVVLWTRFRDRPWITAVAVLGVALSTSLLLLSRRYGACVGMT